MVQLSQEEKQQLTIKHLSGDGSYEKWLIPFAITLSILVLGIIVLVVMYFLKRKSTRDQDARDGYSAAATDSDEALGKLNEITDPEMASSSNNSRHNGPIVINHMTTRQDSGPPPYASANNESNNSNVIDFHPNWTEMPASNL